MSQKDLFIMLGAPLANSRWSWGAIRSSDGAVFLRVWQDRIRRHDGSHFVQVTQAERFKDDPDNLGYQERLMHVERIRQGAPCYMVMCEAVDVHAVPRTVKDFNEDEVFPGGKIVELDGDFWIELRIRVPVRKVSQLLAGDKAELGAVADRPRG